MKENIRSILSLLQSMAGLATGTVFAVLFSVTLLASELAPLDHTVLALSWLIVAFICAVGFYSAKSQMVEEKKRLGQDT